jgi:hypothetical protein
MMIPARANDDHASDSPLEAGAGRRLDENSGRSVTPAKLCNGGNEKGGGGEKAAPPSATVSGDGGPLLLRDHGVQPSSSPIATRPNPTHKSARTALVRERMSERKYIVCSAMKPDDRL